MYQKEKIYTESGKIKASDFHFPGLRRFLSNKVQNTKIRKNYFELLYSNGSISLLPAFHKSFSHNEQSLPERKNQAKFLKT